MGAEASSPQNLLYGAIVFSIPSANSKQNHSKFQDAQSPGAKPQVRAFWSMGLYGMAQAPDPRSWL